MTKQELDKWWTIISERAVKIATLTAERDVLAAGNAQLRYVLRDIRDYSDIEVCDSPEDCYCAWTLANDALESIQSPTAALQSLRDRIRSETLQEAAKLAEDFDIERIGGYDREDDARGTLRKLAAELRKMATEGNSQMTVDGSKGGEQVSMKPYGGSCHSA